MDRWMGWEGRRRGSGDGPVGGTKRRKWGKRARSAVAASAAAAEWTDGQRERREGNEEDGANTRLPFLWSGRGG